MGNMDGRWVTQLGWQIWMGIGDTNEMADMDGVEFGGHGWRWSLEMELLYLYQLWNQLCFGGVYWDDQNSKDRYILISL